MGDAIAGVSDPIGPFSRRVDIAAPAGAQEATEKVDAIEKIHSVQESAGGGESQYLVTLVGGTKIVRRSANEVEILAPKLLASFLSVEVEVSSDNDEMDLLAPPPKKASVTISIDTTTEESSEEVVEKPAPKKNGNGNAKPSPESTANEESDVVVAESNRTSSQAEEDNEVISEPNGTGASSGEEDNGGEDFVDEQMDLDSDEHVEEESDSDLDQYRDGGAKRDTRKAAATGSRKSNRAATRKPAVESRSGDASDSSDGITEQILKNTKSVSTSIAESEWDESDDDVIVFTGERGRAEDQHTTVCVKCRQPPLNYLLPRFYNKTEARAKRRAANGVRKKDADFEDGTDVEEEKLLSLGAWFECGVCISSLHYGCLGIAAKKDFVDDLKAKHLAEFATNAPEDEMIVDGAVWPAAKALIPKRTKIELEAGRQFQLPKCPSCRKRAGRRCGICGISGRKAGGADDVEAPGLMFRCTTCKRTSHYECEPRVEGMDSEQHVKSYFDHGQCSECYTYKQDVDAILAWRQVEVEGEVEEDGDVSLLEVVKKKDEVTGKVFVIPSSKDPAAPAEYLVKWQGISYRRLDWVSHALLAARSSMKLKNFLTRGSTTTLDLAQDDIAEDGEDLEAIEQARLIGTSPLPDPNAESKVPVAWKTVDRILDVYYTSATTGKLIRFKDHHSLPEEAKDSIKLVASCYIKWGELAYSVLTLEEPPVAGEAGYEKYVAAYQIFLTSRLRSMRIPTLNREQIAQLNLPRKESNFIPLQKQPELGGKLMPFQLEGVNFLYFQWWKRTGCILADEMGLGKTVQIITLLSHLSVFEGARPFLVTVPNSTIGNWVREFAKWAPHLRVVPYMGDATSRKIIEEYEMFDDSGKLLKTHVVLATYETLEKNISVFKKIARWDCLVVDEGQRLKGGEGGKLFDAIKALNIGHRILLSGTPLNNNLLELFNLLGFINPKEKSKFAELQKVEITNEVVEKVRGLLKPYFLRRTKDLVLDLPPLTELVVEVTMTALQRQMYISILKRNVGALEGIYQKAPKAVKVKKKRAANWNNILMELRKLLGHPYLISPDVERLDVTPLQTKENLIKASCKLEFLALMLPKLQAQGHRVLLFSQFKITLTIIEDFLTGLGMKFLRLDGDTTQADRQRGIDAYQAKDSPFFCYLLSTRAGGVGINLTAADVVIMYDQDFNPHQDLQAIARAHRIGQVNPVRVFKLLVKGTCEEKIFSDGGKKLGLDHLIVQRIDAVEVEEDVANILEFGARAIFDEEASAKNAIVYTSQDVDELLARTSDLTQSPRKASDLTFSHAKIWEKVAGASKETENETETAREDTSNLKDFWKDILEQNEKADKEANAKKGEMIGRGKRARKTVEYAEKHMIADKSLGGNDSTSSLSGSDRGFVQTRGGDNSSSDDDDIADAAPDDFLADLAKQNALAAGPPKATPTTTNGTQSGPQDPTARRPAPQPIAPPELLPNFGAGFGPPSSEYQLAPYSYPPGQYAPPPLPAPPFSFNHLPPPAVAPAKKTKQAPPPPVGPSAATHTVEVKKAMTKRQHSPESQAKNDGLKRRRNDCKAMMKATAEYDIAGLKRLLDRAHATTSAARAGDYISAATLLIRKYFSGDVAEDPVAEEAPVASTSK